MPSRQIPPSALSHPPLALPLPISAASVFLLPTASLLFFFCLWPPRKWRPSNKTAPASSPAPLPAPPQPVRYDYDQLRRATTSFSPANKLGQGGFGPVFRGSLPSGDEIAVKVMDSGSFQGEMEFRNELVVAASMMKAGKTPHVVYPLGFCSDDEPDDYAKKSSKKICRKKRKKKKKKKKKKRKESTNWFDRMEDGNDDDGFGSSSSGDDDDVEVSARRRALLLVYELMPNGSLQDALLIGRRSELMEWSRRFAVALDISHGLRFLHGECDPPIIHGDVKPSNVLIDGNFSARIADFGLARTIDQTNTSAVREEDVVVRSRGFASLTEVSPVPMPTTSGAEIGSAELEKGELRRSNRSRSAREHVLEWMDSWKGKDKPEGSSIPLASSSSSKRWMQRSLQWWVSLDELRGSRNTEKPRQPREWWREEFSDELEGKNKEKKKKNKSKLEGGHVDQQQQQRRRWESRSWRSRSSRRNSHDWGMSSTPSTRGTMCYAAPECGAAGAAVSDKWDVYSFGVLLLVIISGRRPLQVTASPMAEHANLVKWARILARRGRVTEMVDKSVRGVDKEEAERCVTVGLLCVQRDPERRPSMEEVVRMLSGALDVPGLPLDLLPSTRGGRRGRRKVKCDEGDYFLSNQF